MKFRRLFCAIHTHVNHFLQDMIIIHFIRCTWLVCMYARLEKGYPSSFGISEGMMISFLFHFSSYAE